jgi:hypothetical protein
MLKFGPAPRSQAVILCLCYVLLTLTSVVSVFGQSGADFFLQGTALNPSSVVPGISSTSTISVGTLNGFTGTVDLTCQLTPAQSTGMPTCAVSPSSVTPPAAPSLTVKTNSTTPPTLYTVTVTGTAGALTHQVTLNMTVLAVTPDYTITVTTPVAPSTVHAGSGATGIITVTPINGYTGNVTLSCSAITPTATPAPVCTFSPAIVAITSSVQTSTLTISTTGPAAASFLPRVFYALWLPLPGLALVGLRWGTSGARRGKLLSLSLLFCLIGTGLLLMPACGGTSSSTSTTGGAVTPKNTYTFTLTGADANALAPSNTSPTVSLTVN